VIFLTQDLGGTAGRSTERQMHGSLRNLKKRFRADSETGYSKGLL
jgi:hypothetical protein